MHEVINDGGKLWVLGGKTEEEGNAFETVNGGFTEVLGVVFVLVSGREHTLVVNENSNVSVYATTFNMGMVGSLPIAVKETQGDETRKLLHEDIPTCAMGSYVLPLYIGVKKSNKED